MHNEKSAGRRPQVVGVAPTRAACRFVHNTIHNDATESHNPNDSSNDTLHKVLEGFRDENIKNSTDKIILAINLGTLSKFLEEHGSDYTLLQEYVSEKKILDTDIIHDDHFDIITDFCDGGDVSDKIDNEKYWSEKRTAELMK